MTAWTVICCAYPCTLSVVLESVATVKLNDVNERYMIQKESLYDPFVDTTFLFCNLLGTPLLTLDISSVNL